MIRRLHSTAIAALLLFVATPLAGDEDPTTQADRDYWLTNAIADHRFTVDEAAAAAACATEEVSAWLERGRHPRTARPRGVSGCTVLPYPGGRHPRIGFLDGALNPMRGTKASVFAPWDRAAYAVVDLPEAVFSSLGLLFLAHTHVPTVWDAQGVVLPDVPWERRENGELAGVRTLPNNVTIRATVSPTKTGAVFALSLTNGTPEPLRALRTQVCVMLKGLPGFTAQTLDNKQFDAPVAIAEATDDSQRRVLVAFEHCGRVWGNEQVPCIHADPVFPDCPAGASVQLHGELRFHEGPGWEAVRTELARRYAP